MIYFREYFFNGGTGSSWMFKRFNSLEIMATDKSKTIIKTSKLQLFNNFFFSLQKKMEFIETEATEDNNQQPFDDNLFFRDDDEEEKITGELDHFIDNSDQPGEKVSFYR